MSQTLASLRQPHVFVPVLLVAACVAARLLPNPPNFSPIEATALFAGAYLAPRWLAVLVPLAAMFIADLFLGLHGGMPVIYACIALMAIAGRGLGNAPSALRIGAYGLVAATGFFVVTNFMVWAASGMYAPTFDGLVACYVAAIPFFHNQLAGVAVWSLVLFGGYALLARRVPALRAAA